MIAEAVDKTMIAKGHKEYGIAAIPTNEEAAIALRSKYADLPACTTKDGYEAHRVAIGELTKLRTSVERRRKELKAESLETGRRIDAFARWATDLIESVETPLRDAKSIIDDAAEKKRLAEIEKVRLEQEAIERARITEEEAKRKAEREAEEAKLRAEKERLESERAKIAAERKAFEDAQRIEREKIEAAQKVERDRLAAERAEMERKQRLVAEEQEKIAQAQRAEQQRLEQEEFKRLATIKAENDARDRAIAERAASERRAVAEKEQADRLASMRPDVEVVKAFAKQLRNIPLPAAKSQQAREELNAAQVRIFAVASLLEKWRPS